MTTRIKKLRYATPRALKGQVEITEIPTVKHEGKELAEIDYTETTAWSNWCKIRFKGSNEEYFLPSFRLNVNFKKETKGWKK